MDAAKRFTPDNLEELHRHCGETVHLGEMGRRIGRSVPPLSVLFTPTLVQAERIVLEPSEYLNTFSYFGMIHVRVSPLTAQHT
jgi:hypothetical protein